MTVYQQKSSASARVSGLTLNEPDPMSRSPSLFTQTTLSGGQSNSSQQAIDVEKIGKGSVSTTQSVSDDGLSDDGLSDDGLPPMDRGKDAYLVLAASFILQGLVPGFPFAYGVFQDYYSTSPEFYPNDVQNIAAVGTSAIGIFFFAAPFTYVLFQRFPLWRKKLAVLGAIITVASLVGASFAQNIPEILATQGIIYALGAVLLFYPVFNYLDEWWCVRKGLAYGIMFSGSCVSGIVIPLLMQFLLQRFGFRTALRVWAITTAVFAGPTLVWLKPRVPHSDQAKLEKYKIDFGFLKNRAFWVMQAGNIGVGIGYNLPLIFLPLGLSEFIGTLAISMDNVGRMFGSPLVGLMVDRYHVTTAINLCTIGTLVSILLFWSFATSTPMVLVFALLYGAFAGGFSSTWAGCADPVKKRNPGTDAGMIVSMLQAGKGIGSLVSGPLSGVLVGSDAWKVEHAPFAYGSGYGPLIVFTACTATLGFVSWIAKRLRYFE